MDIIGQPGCPFCSLPVWEQEPHLMVHGLEPFSPVVPGHRLFIPRVHVTDATDVPALTGRVFAEAAAWGRDHVPHGQFNLITSAGRWATQTVFHLHVDVVPRTEDDGLSLPWTGQPKMKALDLDTPEYDYRDGGRP